MTADTPQHIAVHRHHLFLTFAGGSIQHSGVGAPYGWSPVLGASELSIGDDVTGIMQDVASVMMICARNAVAVLYGSDSTDWDLKVLSEDAGAIEWSTQKIGGDPMYLDDRGIRSMRTTQAFGDFRMGTLTQLIEPIFRAKRKARVTLKASVRVRAKDTYRLFW